MMRIEEKIDVLGPRARPRRAETEPLPE